jgi:hypothetical protein
VCDSDNTNMPWQLMRVPVPRAEAARLLCAISVACVAVSQWWQPAPVTLSWPCCFLLQCQQAGFWSSDRLRSQQEHQVQAAGAEGRCAAAAGGGQQHQQQQQQQRPSTLHAQHLCHGLQQCRPRHVLIPRIVYSQLNQHTCTGHCLPAQHQTLSALFITINDVCAAACLLHDLLCLQVAAA